MTDELLEIVKTIDPKFELTFNKFYIGLEKDGQPTTSSSSNPKRMPFASNLASREPMSPRNGSSRQASK